MKNLHSFCAEGLFDSNQEAKVWEEIKKLEEMRMQSKMTVELRIS